MLRRFGFVALGLLTVSCASKDPAYESAMKERATKVCDCCRMDGPAATECIDALGPEPEFPSHPLDAMMTNPNHEISGRTQDQTRICCTRTP